eukprot:gene3613-13698_t
MKAREERSMTAKASTQEVAVVPSPPPAPPPPPPPPVVSSPPPADLCNTEENNEYQGPVVKWGHDNIKADAGACCDDCKQTPTCNAWVFCGSNKGCGTQKVGECWLKKVDLLDLYQNMYGRGHLGIAWTSGSIQSAEETKAAKAKLDESKQAEMKRKKDLHDDPELPLIFLDTTINGTDAGRIEAVLFRKDSPLAAENMRVLCSEEKLQANGKPFTLRGSAFYRIIDRFIDQTGPSCGSIYGGPETNTGHLSITVAYAAAAAAAYLLSAANGGPDTNTGRFSITVAPAAAAYLLSAANGGPDTNTGHFSITVAPAHHLDTHYVIFGEIVSGFETIDRINRLSYGAPNNEVHNKVAEIKAVGQLRKGSYNAPLPDFHPQLH